MGLLDLARQVRGQLPKLYGGTGNKSGWGEATVIPYLNVSGSTIALGTIVQQAGNGGARMEPCDTLDSVDVVGVLVGYYPNGDGNAIVAGDCADYAMGAVMTYGRCRVLVAENVALGEYAFQSSTDGQARGDATVAAGAFGIFESTGDSGLLAYVRLFGAPVFGAGGGGGSPLTTKGDLFGYDTADARVPVGSDGQLLKADSADAQGVSWATQRAAVLVELNAPTGGQQADFRWPWDGTIVRWTLAGDATGSAVVDIWQRTFANDTFPTVANTITASAKPTLSTASLRDSTTLTGWTTTFSRGDMVRVNVDSVSGLGRLTLVLEVTKT